MDSLTITDDSYLNYARSEKKYCQTAILVQRPILELKGKKQEKSKEGEKIKQWRRRK